MTFSEHEHHRQVTADFAIMTISDTRNEKSDESGNIAKRLLIEHGHRVMAHKIVKNDRATIRALIEELTRNPRIQVILTLGGTGISSRDVTIEAVSDLLDKRIEGFGELFRKLSYEDLGEAAMLSRAVAGTIDKKVIFCLPGSKNAVKLALKSLILPGLGHMLWEVNR